MLKITCNNNSFQCHLCSDITVMALLIVKWIYFWHNPFETTIPFVNLYCYIDNGINCICRPIYKLTTSFHILIELIKHVYPLMINKWGNVRYDLCFLFINEFFIMNSWSFVSFYVSVLLYYIFSKRWNEWEIKFYVFNDVNLFILQKITLFISNFLLLYVICALF